MLNPHYTLKASRLITPLGPMIAIADETALYFFEFEDCEGLTRKIEKLRQETNATILSGSSNPISSIKSELSAYFKRTLTEFKTPLRFIGSSFQQRVWHELQKIPSGETRSYADIAYALGKKNAYRAVGQANGANNFFIIVPCHRVVNSSGYIGGYGAGAWRRGG